MPDQSQQYLTRERYETLRAELDELKTARRREVAENLEYAKKLGDLAENAEYHEARERQAEVEDRIMHLDNILKSAKIVNSQNGKHGDSISVGSAVTLQKEDEKPARAYRIVGSEEADSESGKLSNVSPLGAALIGKKKGEKISVKTPKGIMKYEIVDVK